MLVSVRKRGMSMKKAEQKKRTWRSLKNRDRRWPNWCRRSVAGILEGAFLEGVLKGSLEGILEVSSEGDCDGVLDGSLEGECDCRGYMGGLRACQKKEKER
jgi:hypothetical protein